MTGKDDPTISCNHLLIELNVLAGRKSNLKEVPPSVGKGQEDQLKCSESNDLLAQLGSDMNVLKLIQMINIVTITNRHKFPYSSFRDQNLNINIL